MKIYDVLKFTRYFIPILTALPFNIGKNILIMVIKNLAEIEDYWLNFYVNKINDGENYYFVLRTLRANKKCPESVEPQFDRWYINQKA